MIDQVAVDRYARALFNSARSAGEDGRVEQDLEGLCREFRQSGLEGFLANPRFSSRSKRQVLDRAGRGMASPLTLKFLQILLRKSRTGLLEEVTALFVRLRKEARGIVPCEVTLARQAGEAFLDKIRKSLARIAAAPVQVQVKIDPGMMGGIRVRIKNRILDASFRTRLDKLREILLEKRLV